jgi:diacylglycerol kinase family enzyme
MSSRIAVVMNQCAGKNATSIADVERTLSEQGLNATVVCLEDADATSQTASLMRSGYEIIVAAGGDGTVSAVASVLAGTETILGVLPLGTLNHFAKDVGIPLALPEAVRNLADGRAATIDVGEVNGQVFLNNLSMGLYPAFVEARGDVRRQPLLSRWFSIVCAALIVLRRLPLLRARVTVDKKRLKRFTPVVFIGNNQYELEGARIGSRRALDKECLCVIITRSRGPWGLIKLIVRAGLGALRGARDLDELVGREVEVWTKGKRPTVAVDGEVVESIVRPLQCKVRPGALRVLVPAEKPAISEL